MSDVATTPKATKIIGDKVGTMERVLGGIGFDPAAKKPAVFKMRAPILKQGNDRAYMAATDRMWVFVNTYGPDSGENQLHTHTNEDHTFIVLQGKARFFGPKGEETVLERNQGIMLPRGSLYTFKAVGGPLILLRVGCVVDAAKSPWGRETADGRTMLGNAKENGQIETVFEDGAFFE
jgi:mannose-6-phosphate isomerase-like protein (cupin superfamily)